MNRKQLCFIFLLIIMQQLHAQRVKFDLQPVKITVNIKNPRDREIVIQTSPVLLAPRSSKPQQIKIALNKENTGSVNIPLKGPAIIKIMSVWSDSSLDYLVFPGTNFKLELDAEKKDFAIYDTRWKNENDFFHSMLDEATSRLKAIPQEDPIVFFEQWQKENNYNLLLLKKATQQSVSKHYAGWVLQNIQSLSYSVLIRQFSNYVIINEKWPPNVEDYFNSCETLSNIQLNDQGYFTSSTDDEFVAQYYLFAAARKH